MNPAAKQPVVMGPALVLAACIAMVLGAYGFQYIGGFEPCKLCWWQRYVYFAAIPLAAIAVFLAARRQSAARWPMMLTGLLLLAGMGIAGYHAGVEYHWWPGPDTCSGAIGGDIFRDNVVKGLVRCDETPWSLFGVSMAGYNFLISALLAVFSLRLAWKGL
jgi:disulfide bond formation protein DsbB